MTNESRAELDLEMACAACEAGYISTKEYLAMKEKAERPKPVEPKDTNLTTHELQILREIAGELPPSPWGAWVGICLETLFEGGYITAKFGGKLTAKGIQALRDTPVGGE